MTALRRSWKAHEFPPPPAHDCEYARARVICGGTYHFVIAAWRAKEALCESREVLEIVADNLKKAGWSLGCVAAVDSQGQTIWIVDAHRDGKRFLVRAEEKLTTFLELGNKVSMPRISRKRS